MTRANQWLVFGGALSVGAGFLSGRLALRCGARVEGLSLEDVVELARRLT